MSEIEPQEPMEMAFFTDFGGEEVVLTRENTRVVIMDDEPTMSCILHYDEDNLHVGFGSQVTDENIPMLIEYKYPMYHSSDIDDGAVQLIKEWFWNWIRDEIDAETAEL